MNTTTLEELSSDLFITNVDGTRYLAVHISDSESNRAAKRFVEEGIEPGYVIHGETIESWRPAGLKEIDQNIYLYGPYFEGRTIESITTHDPKTAITYLSRLSHALHVIHSNSLLLPRIQTDGVLFLDDGGILILPPMILERLRSVQTDADRMRTFEIYNHPDLTGEDAIVFSLGVLTYQIATKILPFEGEDELELRHRMRELKPLTARQKNPAVREEVADIIDEALGDAEQRPSLEKMDENIAAISREGIYGNIDEAQKARILEQAGRIEKRRFQNFARVRFFKRNARTLVWSSFGAVLFISIAVSMITNLTKPRVTLGMEPLEVVELFYASITDLDHAAIEDCLGEDVGRAEITEATNLFVISRMRLGNEGTTGIMTPEFWHEKDEGQLVETASVYGIDLLEITVIDESTYIANYVKWEQVLTETIPHRIPKANATARLRRDVLTVEFNDTYWLITHIDRQIDDYLTIYGFEELMEEKLDS